MLLDRLMSQEPHRHHLKNKKVAQAEAYATKNAEPHLLPHNHFNKSKGTPKWRVRFYRSKNIPLNLLFYLIVWHLHNTTPTPKNQSIKFLNRLLFLSFGGDKRDTPGCALRDTADRIGCADPAALRRFCFRKRDPCDRTAGSDREASGSIENKKAAILSDDCLWWR